MTMLDYQVSEDFDDDGGMGSEELGFVVPVHEAEGWQMNALLALVASKNGGKIEFDLRMLREVIGRPLAIHFDVGRDHAVVELLPDHAKPVTHQTSARRQ
jgi:hypothetical protein